MIPNFDDQGNLPSGVIQSTLKEFEERFVKGVIGSQTRKDIFLGYKEYCKDLLPLNVATKQWVNGSYTTNKKDPNDIDLVTHLDALKANNKAIYEQLVHLIVNKSDVVNKYKCHVFGIAVYPPDHELYRETLKWKTYWMECFGQDRQKRLKGIIEFDLTDGNFRLSDELAQGETNNG